MRIVQLTPGTGTFYCGGCVRDSALLKGLRELGHDALLTPMYLPLLLESGAPEGTRRIHFGGINVYLQQNASLFRHTPRWFDGMLDAPALLRGAARMAGMTSARDLGAMTVSMLRGEEGRQRKELERLVAWLRDEGRPEVVCLSNLLLLGTARRIRAECGVPVACTMQGEDAFLDALPEPYRTQAWEIMTERAAEADGLIGVSQYYADQMRERLSLPVDKVHVVQNGISLEGFAPATSPPDPPVVGYLARLCADKGLGTLVEAFIELRRRGRVPRVRLHAAGTTTGNDAAYIDGLKKRLDQAGLGTEHEIRVNLSREEKQDFLRGISVFSVPATYGESFGLYLLEAWASGLPVVQPRCAAFPELLRATQGGLLCEPDDPGALADGLEALLLDPEQAAAMGRRGRGAVSKRFHHERMAFETARVLQSLHQAAREE